MKPISLQRWMLRDKPGDENFDNSKPHQKNPSAKHPEQADIPQPQSLTDLSVSDQGLVTKEYLSEQRMPSFGNQTQNCSKVKQESSLPDYPKAAEVEIKDIPY